MLAKQPIARGAAQTVQANCKIQTYQVRLTIAVSAEPPPDPDQPPGRQPWGHQPQEQQPPGPQPTPDEAAVALGAVLSLLYRRLRQPLSEGELTLPERSALSRIDRGGPMTAAKLARIEQISPQSIGVTLAMLERKALIARTADPSDGRRIILSLTEAGHAAVAAKRMARNAILSEALGSNFTPAERGQLLATAPLLERLAESL